MNVDDLGSRMKLFEGQTEGNLIPMLPAMCRIDGRSFSSFTMGLRRPYDERLSKLMVDTTKFLVKETCATCGYTQSDEITLSWYHPTMQTQMFFDGRIQKINSVVASMTSVYFISQILTNDALPIEYAAKLPHFDCRVWNVPKLEEAVNCFMWREWDCTKNSVSMAAQNYYKHKELMGKHSGELQELLFQKGINWNDYNRHFKRGTFVQRRKVIKKFSAMDIEALPPMHEARLNPNLMVERSEIQELDMPPFIKVTNKADVIFNGAEPLTEFNCTKESHEN